VLAVLSYARHFFAKEPEVTILKPGLCALVVFLAPTIVGWAQQAPPQGALVDAKNLRMQPEQVPQVAASSVIPENRASTSCAIASARAIRAARTSTIRIAS
jgi:hypothetical protein